MKYLVYIIWHFHENFCFLFSISYFRKYVRMLLLKCIMTFVNNKLLCHIFVHSCFKMIEKPYIKYTVFMVFIIFDNRALF